MIELGEEASERAASRRLEPRLILCLSGRTGPLAPER
jgi:hypothetical protein